MQNKKKSTGSFFSNELDVLGDKWTLLILRDLLFEGKSTFSEFKASAEKIASNILTTKLARLDAAGFVIKTSSTSNKVKYQYSLSDKAIDLLPVLLALFSWAEKNSAGFVYANPIYQQLSASSPASIRAYSKKLRQQRDQLLGI